MGIASYREDDLARYFEATETMPVSMPLIPLHHCPFCSETFEERKLLSDHLSARHHGHRPVLMINGREPGQIATIRQRLPAPKITVDNCSVMHMLVNGIQLNSVSPEDIPRLLAQQTDAVIKLELVNRFDDVAAPIPQSYHLEFSIPNKTSVDAVDCAFIEHLTVDKLQMTQVTAFLQDGVAKESSVTMRTLLVPTSEAC